MRDQVNEDLPPDGRPTLGDQTRSLTRERIVEGAMAAVAAHGLDATTDDVAEAAGVSRRTVFRHFTSHGELLAAAIIEMWRVFGARFPGPPAPEADVETWLRESAVTLHELNRQLLGRAFWDVFVERPGTSPEVTAALADWAIRRRRFADEFTGATWSALGGRGVPPNWLVDAFLLQLSAFATNAMAAYDTEEAGRVSTRILWAVLTTALAQQRLDGERG